MRFLFRKIPAAIMIIPMFMALIINSLWPELLELGGLSTALFSKVGMPTLAGLLLFFCGTQFQIREAPGALLRGIVLLFAKFIAGYSIGMLVNAFFGSAGFLGISTLAIFTALLSSNGSIYLAITQAYGDEVDIGAYGILSLKDGPFLTLIALGASGSTSIPVQSFVAAILPMLVGMVVGNIYKEVQRYFITGAKITIPMVAFTIGASFNFEQLYRAGLSGLLLGLLALMGSAIVLIAVDKLVLKRPGYAGAALSTVAGSAVVTPTIIAGVVPALKETAEMATIQVAAAVIVTAVLCPILTSWVIKKWGAPKTKIDLSGKVVQ